MFERIFSFVLGAAASLLILPRLYRGPGLCSFGVPTDRRQPFSLRLLTLILFLVEAVEEECGEGMKNKFENDLREVLLQLPLNRARENNKSHAPGPCWCGRNHTVFVRFVCQV